MRNNSAIQAQATGKNTAGNININSPNGFVVAFPNQDNNIIATAEAGFGGEININANRVYGFDKERIQSKDITALFLNDENDINSTSADPQLSGTVNINTPDIDPSRGLIELPQTVTDPNEQIAQNPCQRGADSEFLITGKGGIPQNPNENLDSDSVRVGLVDPVAVEVAEAEVQRGGRAEEKVSSSNPQEKVPAQGWIFTDDGKVMLTAIDPTGEGVDRSRPTSNSCSVSP